MCSLETFPLVRAMTPFARGSTFWPSSHRSSLGLNILIPTCIHPFIRQNESSLYSLQDSVLGTHTLHGLVQLLREACSRTLSFLLSGIPHYQSQKKCLWTESGPERRIDPLIQTPQNQSFSARSEILCQVPHCLEHK